MINAGFTELLPETMLGLLAILLLVAAVVDVRTFTISNSLNLSIALPLWPNAAIQLAVGAVELGSGQSFMLAGLLRNANTNNIDKALFLGDLPILGALFRSTRYRRSETELVIIVTPYLVRPVSGQLALPTDGYRAPNDVQRVIEGQTFVGPSGGRRVVAPVAGGVAAAPGFKL